MGSAERERALWAEHYGAVAGWLLAVTGSRETAFALADHAFIRLFSRLPASAECARRRLYREALAALGHWRLDDPDDSPGGWLAHLVEGLPPRTQRCVLLEYAGLSAGDIARVLHLHSEGTARRLLAAAGPPARPGAVIAVPVQRNPAQVSPERDDARVGR
jgi:DNA-directed RNA polymerase specialized sigma24 family protein